MSHNPRSSSSITQSGSKRDDPLSSHKPSSRKRAFSKPEEQVKAKKKKDKLPQYVFHIFVFGFSTN